MTEVRNQRVTVLGLGRFGGGIAVCKWLAQQQAKSITVVDAEPAARLSDSIAKLAGLPIEFRLGSDQQRDADFAQADLVIASPAVPPKSLQLATARAAGVPITTEICLFVERCKNTVVGVTGTKGKSTTTALLGKMLASKRRTWVGGNIGVSLLAELPRMEPDHLVVLELSSYMLHYLGERQFAPHAAVVTMVAADHLDWHGSRDSYVDAKRNLVRFQNENDFAVLNKEDSGSASFAANTRAKVKWFGLRDRRYFELKLAGEHNQLNAQAAFAAANVFGVDWDTAQAAVLDFAGLPHRLELVHEDGGVRFINDSIATIPAAAAAALRSFPAGKVIQIVGGSAKKDLPLGALCADLGERAKAVLCIGETGPKLAAAMQQQEAADSSLVEICGDIATAIARARSLALPGDVVLLSPGAPSYDQFVNFEQRGQRFAELARESTPAKP